MIFWDTSALVRCYEGSEASQPRAKNFLIRGERHLGSALIRIEALSAMRRRFFRDRAQHTTLQHLLAQHLKTFDLSPIDDRVLAAGERLVERHGLRAADALHVSTALLLSKDLGRRQFRFLTADAEQSRAAKRENLKVVLLV
jgi:predicted nucleic acid-binding protein